MSDESSRRYMTTSVVDRQLLFRRSLQVIREGQTPEGAFLACITFPTYRYSWFRDGAFIAHALDDWNEHEMSAAFHSWAVRVIKDQSQVIAGVDPSTLRPERILHTRYRADGSAGEQAWPNFQLDGLGTWLWAFGEHLNRTDRHARGPELLAVRQVADYLLALWAQPNFDCWEEFEDRLHPATLGALHAGLQAAARILAEPRYHGAAEAIASYLLTTASVNGHFGKHVGSQEVDANLLWLAYPYGVVPVTHPYMIETVRLIRKTLLDPDGGVHRYALDSYYGGGSWPLLSAALAHYHLETGEVAEAERLLRWIEAQANERGNLPEQSNRHMNVPAKQAEWVKLWGESAAPLLWSHAAYLTLLKRFEGIG